MPEEKDATYKTEATCGFLMMVGRRCGRAIYWAPEHDDRPVCLMHSYDKDKSEDEFSAEFDRILTDAEETDAIADLQGFVFPAVNYWHRIFKPRCDFQWATFTQKADFSLATFIRDTNFRRATFTQGADFSDATFTNGAEFRRATFIERADFTDATFTQSAGFSWATFTEDAHFTGATFLQGAYFARATFTQNAKFRKATFTQDADFSHATFTRDTNFNHAEFTRGADFRYAIISGAVTFRETEFREDVKTAAGLQFSQVRIESPERVEFYQTDLRQALFFNTDVSKFDFTLVRWRERGRQHGIRGWRLLKGIGSQHSRRLCLFEEDVTIDESSALRPLEGSPDARNYQLIAETYQQLKRNFDAKGDYWTAGHWHYGEMEMQRRHCDWKPRWARWLKQNLSLVALYERTSAYGESYTLPLLWLVGVLAFFAVVYPIVGLEIHLQDVDKTLRYSNYGEFFRMNPGEHPGGFWGVLVHGAMASLSVAGFQRELRYVPSYPWGRLLALLELLLTTTMGGLFALAIRRQFKRS